MSNTIALLGRILMGGFFIEAGIGKLLASAKFIAAFTHLGLPVPPLAYAVAVVVELGGGLMILLGWRIRPAAAILALWCVATALIARVHNPIAPSLYIMIYGLIALPVLWRMRETNGRSLAE